MLFAHLIYVLANYNDVLCPAGRRVLRRLASLGGNLKFVGHTVEWIRVNTHMEISRINPKSIHVFVICIRSSQKAKHTWT